MLCDTSDHSLTKRTRFDERSGLVERVESANSPSVTLSASKWMPIGPAPVKGPFAGRIDVAAPDPSNSNVMYLGANNGGIWKTTNWLDSYPNWTPITDKPQILWLAIHEHDLVVFPGKLAKIFEILVRASAWPRAHLNFAP